MEANEQVIWASIWWLFKISSGTYAVVLGLAAAHEFFQRRRKIRPRLFSLRNLHDKFLNRYSDYTTLFSAWHAFRLFLNLAVCGLYVYSTYQKTVSGTVLLANRIFAAFFIFEIVRFLTFESSALRCVGTFSLFFSIFSIPSLLLASGDTLYLHFGFLRAIALYNAYIEMERGILLERFERNRMRWRILIQFITLFYVLGCGIQMLEIPGDLLSADVSGDDWHFFNCFYFVIVTLSTVGFGDISPETLQGRIYTIGMIIVGIIVFTNIVEELRKDSKRHRLINKYNPIKEKRHVIVSGTPTIQEFKHFVTEFFWGDGSFLNRTSHIVVVLEEEYWDDDIWYTEIAHNPFLRLHITYLVGSVKDPLVLQRAGIESANAFFILTSPSSGDILGSQGSFQTDRSRKVQLADTKTVMTALAVRNVRSDIPIFGQTLLDDSNDQVRFALTTASNKNDEDLLFRPDEGVAKYCTYKENLKKIENSIMGVKYDDSDDSRKTGEEVAKLDLVRSEHVCIQQLYTALMVANIKANGVSTLITNLHIEYKDESKEGYSHHESPWLKEYAMGSECSLLNAFIPEKFDGLSIQDVAPILFQHGIVVVGSRAEDDLETNVLLDVTKPFQNNRIYLFLTYLDQKHLFLALKWLNFYIEEKVDKYKPFRIDTPDADDDIGDLEDEKGGEYDATEEDEEYKENEYNFEDSSKNPLQMGTDNFLAHREDKIHLKNHVIIAVDGHTLRDHLLYFLKKLNPENSKAEKIGVVILQPHTSDDDMNALRALDPDVLFVEGKPASQRSWKQANFEKARAIVTLSDYSLERKSADAQAIYTLLALDSMAEEKHKMFICSELIDEQSIELLRQPTNHRRQGLKLGSIENDDNDDDDDDDDSGGGDLGTSSEGLDKKRSCFRARNGINGQNSTGKLMQFSRSEKDISNSTKIHRDYLFSRYRYTAGELLVHSTADSLLVREYAEPGFIDFIKGLVGERSQRKDETIPVGQKIHLFSLAKLVSKGSGKKFKQLFEELIGLGVTPLGLYRSGKAEIVVPEKKRWKCGKLYSYRSAPLDCFLRNQYNNLEEPESRNSCRKINRCLKPESNLDPKSKLPQNKLPYVLTLPEPDTVLHRNDGVYVLCQPEKVENIKKILGSLSNKS